MIIITFKYRHRKEIIIGLIISFIVVTVIVLGIYYSKNNKEEDVVESDVEEKSVKKEKVKEEIKEYKVDIKGEVNNPGIYTMNSNSRVIDVIEEAGGLTENANTTVINLSKKISDEMVIIIYSNNEVNDFIKTKEMEEYLQEKCNQKDENSLENDACISDSPTIKTSKININTATKDELMTLTGIGESKANEIINYRTTNGNFNSIEDIKNVSGIGDSLFAKIKENITIE